MKEGNFKDAISELVWVVEIQRQHRQFQLMKPLKKRYVVIVIPKVVTINFTVKICWSDISSQVNFLCTTHFTTQFI